MTWEMELLQPPYGAVSEGPVWDGETLLYTQIQACRIMRYDPNSGSLEVVRETNYSNGLVMDSDRRICACEGGGRRVVRYEHDGSVTALADGFEGKSLNIPNDLVIDGSGNIWFTDPFYEGAAGPFSFDRVNKELDHDSVYKLTNDGSDNWSIQRVTFDTTRPNGLLFSKDYKTLYVAQSGRRADEFRQLRGYHVQEDGTLGDGEVLHEFGENRGIDGMCLDVEGNVVATAGWENGGPGPSIYVFSPSGEVLQLHDVPCNRPTNCCFAGADLSTLYITSTDGHLFKTQTDLQGLDMLG